MPPDFRERYSKKVKAALFSARGEVALALILAAGAIATLLWFRLLRDPGAEAPAESARSARLRLDVLDEIAKNVRERQERLEKVFERAYPDPFARQ